MIDFGRYETADLLDLEREVSLVSVYVFFLDFQDGGNFGIGSFIGFIFGTGMKLAACGVMMYYIIVYL